LAWEPPPPGWRLRIEESLPSTQDVVVRQAVAGEPEGLALLARRQTGGRARDARVWDSPPGNLYISVLLRPGGPAREAPRYALLAAVALAEALARFLPDPGLIRLKWPNDLLIGDAKLAGILTESAADAAGRIDWVVFGLGANLAEAPEVPGRRTACLAPHAPPPEAATAALLRQIDLWRGRGFAAVRQAWMARGPAMGERLLLRAGTRRVEGIYAGLAEDGSLLIDTGAGPRPFTSGETGGD
jgi:BirA family biotin operon repressor/biotin-[acetyl-CoA-carboxylase] ligase